MNEKPILVLGGNGKTGRRVAERLHDKGLAVRIGSRSGTPPFDWTDRGTWRPVLEGASSAYVTFQPDLALPWAAEAVGAFAELAADCGVRRLVLLAGRGEPGAQRSEEALQRAPVDWTILRCSWFSQNFSESFFLEGILAGELALPAGDIPEPFVDTDDIADAAVAALLDERHIGRTYELTGPRALTFAQAVDAIAKATGRPLRYRRIPHQDFLAGLAAHGVPEALIELLDELFAVVLDGRNREVKDGVRQALGRAPRDFSDYARATAATGVWNAPAMSGEGAQPISETAA
jgi:uncharacterized protein YbjT (DUF2867 family)